MNINRQVKPLILAILIVPIAAFSNLTLAQQHIAEKLLEESIENHSSNDKGKADSQEARQTDKPSEKIPYKIDPRLTPEYWGIEEDTII